MILLEGYNAGAAANLIGTPYFLLEVNDFNNNNPAVVSYNCNTEHSFNIRNILAKILMQYIQMTFCSKILRTEYLK